MHNIDDTIQYMKYLQKMINYPSDFVALWALFGTPAYTMFIWSHVHSSQQSHSNIIIWCLSEYQ